MEVYNVGTLLGLLVTVAANLDQRFNHPFKCIHLIIPYNKAAGIFHFGKKIGFFPLIGLYVGLGCHFNCQK
jgi:hypothetical protein